MKVKRGTCATGVILLALAGCVLPDYFRLNYFQSSPSGGDRVVSLSLDNVTLSTQAALGRLGWKVDATPQGEDVRIVAKKPSGEQFTLVLTRVRNERGDQTRVRMEGTTNAHEEMVFNILAQLEIDQSR